MYKGTMEKNEVAPIPSSLWTSLEQLERRLNRIEAALRDRMRPAGTGDESFAFGRGTVNRKRFGYVNWRNEFVRLSPRELMLLEMFAEHPNEVLARDMLLSRLWGIDYYGNTRTLDQHIGRLRQKLGTDGMRIVTVSHVGYAYESDLADLPHA